MAGPEDEIRYQDNGSKGVYVIDGPGGAKAEMGITKVGEHQIIIDHTDVDDAFRGASLPTGSRPVRRSRDRRRRRQPCRCQRDGG